ncbi:methylamine utilization protein [Massilia atriviolacea]|uniref:Methylamine utilization protein n=1 Tax=Massilia atriviolacea TaxID=2495579 RepID=A0A430HTY6_9BURK|nr:methylamine utilization protein [Massilia atriviolacea]RSZ61043.1 methylamine utilization protein [Massilia atriviolacea]
MNALLRPITLAALALASSAAGAAAIAVQVTDSSGKPLADVVVSAVPEGNAPVPQTMKAAEIEQRGLKFLPLVSVIQTGSKISFPNFDRVKHHIYSFSPAKKFDQKLYSGVAAAPQVFDKAGTVVLGCNIHDGMVAYIRVVDTPFFARTDAAGAARIELPAAGKYTLSSWHFNMAGAAAEQSVAVKADGATAAGVKLALKPPAADAGAP